MNYAKGYTVNIKDNFRKAFTDEKPLLTKDDLTLLIMRQIFSIDYFIKDLITLINLIILFIIRNQIRR